MRDASGGAPQAGAGDVTIGIAAGEASGDALGALLIHALRSRLPNARFVGIAGPKMEEAGCEVWVPVETLSIGGFVEVLGRVPELWRMRRTLARRIRAAHATLFIGIDAPDFNLGLERILKRRGVRTIHFVSPSVWAWRRERIATIARSVHRLLALFPFEPPLYADAGIDVTYVGHPLAHDAATPASRRAARDQLKIPIAQPVFALLPGSRRAELDMHAELVLRTAAAIHAQKPNASFIVPLATRATRDVFDGERFRLGLDALPMTLLYGHARDALEAADVSIVASGTATLEAALARCPHIIFYRVKALTEWYIRRKYLLPYVGLPNVLAGRFVVPEFLQDEATVDNLTQAAVNLYDDAATRSRLETLFGGFASALNVDTGAIAAHAIMSELRR